MSIPQSKWTVDVLEELAMNPRHLRKSERRGCYLLVAISKDRSKVELYFGSSDDMFRRFTGHVRSVVNTDLAEQDIQYFHRRCRALKVQRPLFIPVSHEQSKDDLMLRFQESGHIAITGTWIENEDLVCTTRICPCAKAMKLSETNESLPSGWVGANCEIP